MRSVWLVLCLLCQSQNPVPCCEEDDMNRSVSMRSVWLVLCLLCLLGGAVDAKKRRSSRKGFGKIKIEVSQLRSNKGQLLILLFDKSRKKWFPARHKKALRQAFVPIKKRKGYYEFKKLPYGTYALSIVHDANKNFRLEANVLGIPEEGFAVSKNIRAVFGPPSFKDAGFRLKRRAVTVHIKMHYNKK